MPEAMVAGVVATSGPKDWPGDSSCPMTLAMVIGQGRTKAAKANMIMEDMHKLSSAPGADLEVSCIN